MTLKPSGVDTNLGHLGVTMTVASTSDERAFEVEDSGAFDSFLTVRIDGQLASESRFGGKVPYYRQIVAFMTPHLDTFIASLSDAA